MVVDTDAEAETTVGTEDTHGTDCIVLLDCETNGVGRFRPPEQDLCQLAFIVYDRSGDRIVDEYASLVRGTTCVCPNHVSGFTLEDLDNGGVVATEAIQRLCAALDRWQPVALYAHNLDFDVGVLKRAGMVWDHYPCMEHRCTMKRSTQWCALRVPGRRSFKWPKLSELAERLQVNLQGYRLHDARDDCRLLLDIVKRETTWDPAGR